ncbi:MAG TPA: cytochrome c, partial [Vicinamibacterales bacterium]
MIRPLTAVAIAGLVASAVPAQAQTPTFSKDVAPILYKNCSNCHRAGEIGPMPLMSYKDARPFAKAIAMRVQNGTMPPWHADDPTHHKFSNDRSLPDADRETIVKWATGGAPEGNPKDLPAPPKFADGWMMGTPDAVFSMQEAYPIPATGTLDYKFFEIPTNLTEDKWLQAFEIRPGDRTVVHHVIAYVRPPAPAGGTAPAAAAQANGPRPTPPFH